MVFTYKRNTFIHDKMENLEVIMLSEIKHRKTKTLQFHLIVDLEEQISNMKNEEARAGS